MAATMAVDGDGDTTWVSIVSQACNDKEEEQKGG